ncbi:MAG TPA: DUF2993 domain-containing protein [Jatrophihabitantaceae bacterium]|nr:DUF2993 domain-containing protein [Jatrophihabitantaceae bacterium]
MVDAGPAAMAGPMTRPRRTRRRRWPLVLTVVFALLLVALVIADRVAVSAADAAVEKRLAEQAPFDASNKPDVSIHGIPFLTQALSGKYDEIEVSGDALRLEQVSGVDFDAHMHGVHVPFSKALSRDVKSLPIDRVDASVGIPYAEAARLIGIKGLTLSAGRKGALHVSVPVTVPGSSATVTGTADATVRVSGNRLSYKVGQITVAGVQLPAAVTSAVESQMDGAFTLPSLPYRLEVTGVTATSSGVQVTAHAAHIVVDTTT